MPLHLPSASFDEKPVESQAVSPDAVTASRSPSTPAEASADVTISFREGAAPVRALHLPEIPGFRVVRRLSGGGMGDVFEVVHLALQKTFALKMIRPDKTDGAFLARFAREAKAMVELDHPNIARFYQFGDVHGCPFITMRFIRGATLRDHLDQYRSDIPKAVSLLLKIVDAVQYLHDRGNIHRDLKPSNILIDESGEPFLCDFGLVKNHPDEVVPANSSAISDSPSAETAGLLPLDDSAWGTLTHHPLTQEQQEQAITQTGEIWGTYCYMSPEQSRGSTNQINRKADIWALGVILYEMITGQRPFASSDTAELLRMIREAPITPPSEWNPQIDARFDRIVLTCLEKSPMDRYPSVGALADELREWLRPSPSTAPPKQPNRLWTRWLPLGLIATAIATILVVYLVPWTPPSVAEKRFDFPSWARAELAAGRSVELIDGQGNPAWDFPIIVGHNNSKIDRNADRWTIHTTNVAMVELLDDPGIEDFILRAEIHGNKLAALPKAGLFVGHTRIDDPSGTWHYQLEALYQEAVGNFPSSASVELKPKKAEPAKEVKRYAPSKVIPVVAMDPLGMIRRRGLEESGGSSIPQECNSWVVGDDKKVPGGPWRNLEIEARDSTWVVHWDSRQEYTLPIATREEIVAHLQRPLQGLPVPPLQFKPRGGLGMLIEGGSASFRRVEISPVKK